MKNVLPLVAGLLALAGRAAAQDWKPEDLVRAEAVSGFEFSPDGRSVVWVKRLPAREKDGFVTKIFLTQLEKTEKGRYLTRQLTQGTEESEYSPVFSRDNKLIYFLSCREKGKKLWALPVAGGEAEPVQTFEQVPGSLRYLNDTSLVYTASEGKTLYERQLEERKDDVEVIEDTAHFRPTRLFAFYLKSKDIRRLTTNRLPVGQWAVSKDGAWGVTQLIGSPHFGIDAQPKPQIVLWNFKTGENLSILPEKDFQQPGDFEFAADGSGFYFSTNQSNDPRWNGAGISKLYFFRLRDRQILPVDLRHAWGMSGQMELAGNHLLVGLANGPTNLLGLVEKRSDTFGIKPVSGGRYEQHVSIEAMSKTYDRLIFSYSTASTPTQVRVGRLVFDDKKGSVSIADEGELVQVNPDFLKKSIARSEVMRWKGYRGEEVTGILYYPKNYQPGRAYPLMLSIHGGPSAADLDAWREGWSSYPQLLSQKGAFVLRPNYHGSSNHGQAFVESIAGNYYDPELEDITKGVEGLIGRGMVHRDSLGVMGWSNGAILTTMLSVRYPGMFKVAAPGAGDVNWTSDFGTCSFGVSFDQHYFGGAPWDNLNGKTYNEAYITKSPLFELEKVITPTIIFHGSEDRQVPRDQGWEYYRALQQIGKAPVRFLWFPGAYHGLAKPTHQLRKINEELTWFDRYLFGNHKPDNEAFKKESPLATLLEREKMESVAGLMGTLKNGVLIPETVSLKKDSIAIGRYEVTQAQFREFSKSPTGEALNGNHPAQVSHQQALAYCRWLSEKTGQPYRLPNAAEAKALQEKAIEAAARENTLSRWAGYTLTHDEVPLLLGKVAELKKTSLLQEVGRDRPLRIGAADLYDVAGNVSEWFTQPGGQPGTYGWSAYDFFDAAAPVPATTHVGFRVVQARELPGR